MGKNYMIMLDISMEENYNGMKLSRGTKERDEERTGAFKNPGNRGIDADRRWGGEPCGGHHLKNMQRI